MKFLFSRFVKDTCGSTAIEYGLIASLLAAALVGGATAVGSSLNQTLDVASQHLEDSNK